MINSTSFNQTYNHIVIQNQASVYHIKPLPCRHIQNVISLIKKNLVWFKNNKIYLCNKAVWLIYTHTLLSVGGRSKLPGQYDRFSSVTKNRLSVSNVSYAKRELIQLVGGFVSLQMTNKSGGTKMLTRQLQLSVKRTTLYSSLMQQTCRSTRFGNYLSAKYASDFTKTTATSLEFSDSSHCKPKPI